MLTPKLQEKLTIDKGSPKAEKRLELQWAISAGNLPKGVAPPPPIAKVRLTVLSVRRNSAAPGGVERTPVAQQVVVMQGGRGKYPVVLKKAGLYEWQLHDEQGGPLPAKAESTVGQFTLMPNYEAIQILDPLVGGQAGASNTLKGQLLKNFDVTLRWKPYEGSSGKYKISFSSTADFRKVLMVKEVMDSAYKFNKDKIFTGQIFYQVVTTLPTGFTVTSKPEKFAFNFLPPVLVVPEDKTTLSNAQLKNDDNTILFTRKCNLCFSIYHLIDVTRSLKIIFFSFLPI